MRVVLEVVSGPCAGKKKVLLESYSVSVGRADEQGVELVIPSDARMSRAHFELVCKGGVCRLKDLRSSNGTFLNGERITAAEVNDGDRIEAGDTRFKVSVVRDTAPLDRPTTPQRNRQAPPSTTTAPWPDPGMRRGAETAVERFPPFNLGLRDDDLLVRRQALLAAAWQREPWLLDHLRTLARRPALEHLAAHVLLGILGLPTDIDGVLVVTAQADLGPRRFEAAAAFGHPGVMDLVLAAMTSPDPAAAAAAGAAFTRITGIQVSSGRRAAVAPPGGMPSDPLDREFLDEVVLPDPQKALAHWKELRDKYAAGTRWCRGYDLAGGADDQVLARLDLRSRFEARLRMHFRSQRYANLTELEIFPQPRWP